MNYTYKLTKCEICQKEKDCLFPSDIENYCSHASCFDCLCEYTTGHCFICSFPFPIGFPTGRTEEAKLKSLIWDKDPLSFTKLNRGCYDSEYYKYAPDPLYDRDITVLKLFHNLEVLDLGRNRITSLEPLRGLTKLKILYLEGNPLISLEPLSGLTNLEVLDISFTQKEKEKKKDYLEPLRKLTKLRTLKLSGIKNVNIAPIKCLTTLKVLDLAYCRRINIDALNYLLNLEVLDLQQCKLKNACFVSKFTKLKCLNLASNKIVKPFDLKSLVELTHLSIRYNPIECELIAKYKNPFDYKNDD